MSDDFNGRVALITGSARGIGLAIATRLGQLGATVVLSDILDETLAQSLDALTSQGIEEHILQPDGELLLVRRDVAVQMATIHQDLTEIKAKLGI